MLRHQYKKTGEHLMSSNLFKNHYVKLFIVVQYSFRQLISLKFMFAYNEGFDYHIAMITDTVITSSLQ